MRSDFVKSVIFSCQPQTSSILWSFSGGLLLIKVAYLEDLEGRPATVTVGLNGQQTIESQLVLNISMVSCDAKLIIYKKYAEMKKIRIYFEVISFVVLALFLASSFTHKMIGV
jgi:hypothetical protein